MTLRKHRSDESLSRSRDAYHVVVPGKAVNGKPYSDPELALIAAQSHLEHKMSPATTLEVVRVSLFGPATTLYRVNREEESGAILTTAVERED